MSLKVERILPKRLATYNPVSCRLAKIMAIDRDQDEQRWIFAERDADAGSRAANLMLVRQRNTRARNCTSVSTVPLTGARVMPEGYLMGIATLVIGVLGFLPALLASRRKSPAPDRSAGSR